MSIKSGPWWMFWKLAGLFGHRSPAGTYPHLTEQRVSTQPRNTTQAL